MPEDGAICLHIMPTIQKQHHALYTLTLCKYIPVDCIKGVQGILQKETFPDPQPFFMH